jgi:hypothetical protein
MVCFTPFVSTRRGTSDSASISRSSVPHAIHSSLQLSVGGRIQSREGGVEVLGQAAAAEGADEAKRSSAFRPT